MSSKTEHHIEELASIIRALADVWPNDRDNLMVAGAKFEETVEELDSGGSQLQKLIDLAWEGLKHLYQEDNYFISVKTATMNAVNTIREYLLRGGDIAVEDFERSCEHLENALSGEGESADEVIELEEIEKYQDSENKKQETEEASNVEREDSLKEYSLNDLASFIMTLNESKVTKGDLGNLEKILESLVKKTEGKIPEVLKEAVEILPNPSDPKSKWGKGWLSLISAKTEEAIEIEENQEWETEESIETKSEDKIAEEVAPESEVFSIPEDVDLGMMGEFVTECRDLIETAESALLDLEESPDDKELINTVFRAFHTIKGTSAFMGLDPISKFTHSAENLLNMVRDGDLPFDRPCADITLESIDILKKLLSIVETAEGGDALPTDKKYDLMLRVLDDICEDGQAPVDALEKEGGIAAINSEDDILESEMNEASESQGMSDVADSPNGSVEKNAQKSDAESTVRVNVGRLDRLIDMVGELVIAHSVVAQDETIEKNSELVKKVNHTTKILRELQDTSLTLRMVPLKATIHKMNRLVRDLARKAGKDVKFSTMGEDTEIDRNMVDIINEPLVHMLRNAIDHGIEEPKDRAKTDKPATANVWFRAYQEGGKVVIEIEDDGKGIDKDKILKKAIEKGLVEKDKQLTESEIFSLIFLPGFSSVDKVTNLSGRGVGMDVVRRSIEQLHGKIEVSSQKGKGTKVSIELPFTLAITDGMLVRVGDQRFIIPTINIDMTFRAEENDIYTVMGDTEQVNFRGRSVPVIRLHRLFNIEGGIEDLQEGTLLVIKNNNKRYALLVDEVIGQQQLVGKSINMIFKMPNISGGAILGDGRVGLILDTASVMH